MEALGNSALCLHNPEILLLYCLLSLCLSLLHLLELLKAPNIRPSDLSVPSLLSLLWTRQSHRFFYIQDPEASTTGHLRIYKGINYYHYYYKKINRTKKESRPLVCFFFSFSFFPSLFLHKAFGKTEAVQVIMTDRGYSDYILLTL